MIERIKFASIPKSASRSLKELGLLGEVDEHPHTKITEYPNWQDYDWHFVYRGGGWEESWWLECQKSRNLFTHWLGFKFENLKEDLALLDGPYPSSDVPRRPGVNGWIPEDFKTVFPAYREQNLGIHEYCYDIITCRIPCKRVDIEELDTWLISKGLQPIHKNTREII